MIETVADESKFLNNSLWKACKRYVEQKITIKVFNGNKLDAIIPVLQKQISTLNDFEKLQKAFYNYLYPALYAIKNSTKTNELVVSLIEDFKEVYEEVKDFGIDKHIKLTIESAIDTALDFNTNTKSYSCGEHIFSNILRNKDGLQSFIPTDCNKITLPTSKTENIKFTGYPYLEYTSKYMINAISNYFIPRIKILCWPNEASLTFSYIKRRLIAEYFTDKLPVRKMIAEKYLLKNENSFQDEVDSFLKITGTSNFENEDTDEDVLMKLHTYKYKGYSTEIMKENVYKVKCDIINFDDGCFMFLPKAGKILAETEARDGKMKIRNSKITELIIGNKVFKYKKDIAAYREISKRNNKVKESFAKLTLWKEALEKVYLEADESTGKLETLLKQTKRKLDIKNGNPNRLNIHRWLYDDEIISPDSDNFNFEKLRDCYDKYLITFNSIIVYTIVHI